ncbi:MAG: SWIM zinc finger family protein [Planctomycetota bacterium]
MPLLAKKHAKTKGRSPQPVTVSGYTIASTFWGKAWCDHLETWKDYDNRLPRGKTYLRNGSVVDLFVSKLRVEAIVAGSEPYRITITFTPLPDARWKKLRSECTASINSLLDLLAGKFSKGIMELLTSTRTGLFPAAGDLKMSCDCPDSSRCCKHLAAVFYAIGAKLDHHPELLFVLRGVDHQELVAHATSAENLDRELKSAGTSELQTDDLAQLFGIELASTPEVQPPAPPSPPAARRGSGAQARTAAAVAAGATNRRSTAQQAAADRAAATGSKAEAATAKAAEAGRPETDGKKAGGKKTGGPKATSARTTSGSTKSGSTKSPKARSAKPSVPVDGTTSAANSLLNAIAETLAAKSADTAKSPPARSRVGKRAAK